MNDSSGISPITIRTREEARSGRPWACGSQEKYSADPIFDAYERPASFAGTECSTELTLCTSTYRRIDLLAIQVLALSAQIPDKDPDAQQQDD
jgi:hypothetical protein